MTDCPPDIVSMPGGSAISFGLEVPTLKSLYIEMFFGDTLLGSGTAFLAANDRESNCALITNRHNVTGRNQETGECLSKTGGIPDSIVIYFHRNPLEAGQWKKIKLPLYRDDGTPWWIEHPRLGAAADVVALNLRWGSDVHKLPYYMKLDLDRKGLYTSPAEIVSVIGFPFGLSSAGKFPIWSTGFVAQELSLVTPENPVFLIDCRSRRGQSGSAVVSYRAGSYRHVRDGRVVSTISPDPVWEFLGIYSGRVNPESDLGRVWHVSAVEEVLNAAAAVATAKNLVEPAVVGVDVPAD
ncbi:hypothetical protein PBS_30350 [Paraburkholderia sp. 2C]